MNENRFWLALWSVVATAIVVMVLGGQIYHTNRNEMISKSADPIATACALQVDEPNLKAVCLEKVKKQ